MIFKLLKYNEFRAKIGIEQLMIMDGQLPGRVLGLVINLVATIDYEHYYFSNNVFVCLPKPSLKMNLKYFVGLLNSKLATWYYRTIQPREGKLFAELKINVLNTIPTKKVDLQNPTQKSQHDHMVSLVDQMLATQKKLHATSSSIEKKQYQQDADILDKQIDTLVYELYELTPEEVKVVEGKTRITDTDG